MIIPDALKNFLTNINDLTLGYSEINIIKHSALNKEQIGYSVDSKGNSLITDNEGDWKDGWIVIATDNVGDPIVVDINSSSLTILNLAHGEGEWDPIIIADSLKKFKEILISVEHLSKNRKNPVELEANPISKKEKANLLTMIKTQSPDAELSFWETFLDSA